MLPTHLRGPVAQGIVQQFAGKFVRRKHNPPSRFGKRAWQDSNLRHTAPETVALSPELQARANVGTAKGCYPNACGASMDRRGD